VILRVGRTELNLGNQRLVSGGDWGNVTRTFDVATIGLGAGCNRVDIFAATFEQVFGMPVVRAAWKSAGDSVSAGAALDGRRSQWLDEVAAMGKQRRNLRKTRSGNHA